MFYYTQRDTVPTLNLYMFTDGRQPVSNKSSIFSAPNARGLKRALPRPLCTQRQAPFPAIPTPQAFCATRDVTRGTVS